MDRTEWRRRRDARLGLAERALLTIAVLALGWYAAVHIVARLDQAAQNRVLDRLADHRAPPRDSASSLGGGDASSRAGGDSSTRTGGTHTARRAAPHALVGRIEVPRLGLSAIVREGVDDATLRRAVGHVPDTALPGEAGNAALAAHRDTFFRPLKHIRKGDRINVTTPDGAHEYRVTETRVVAPDDVSVLAPTMNPTLTLVTCYPFNFVGTAPKRFVVRAETDSPLVAAAGVAATAGFGAVPIKASAAISEPGGKAQARRSTRRPTGKTARAKPPAAQAKAAEKPPRAKAGPFRKFLQLFTGPPQPKSKSAGRQ